MREQCPVTSDLLKDKKTLTFPALASLTLAACGGGALITPTPPSNKAPTTAGTTTLTTDEDSIDAALGITTPTDADGDSLTITVTGLPTGGTLTTAVGTEVNSNSTLSIFQLTGLVFTPDTNLNDSNTDFGSFAYSVSDGSLTSTGTVNISVTPVNDDPEFTSGPDISIEENHSDVNGFTATDIDDDALTYSISGGTDQAFFTIDEATGALTFIDRPDFENAQDSDQDNIYIVEITIDDGNGGSATQTFNIIVSDVVTGISISNLSVDENSSGAVVGDLRAAIDDLNATHEYTYALSGTDDESFEVVDGQLKLKDNFSANYEEKNSYTVTVTATDSGGLSISSDYTVIVNDLNDAPSAINISGSFYVNDGTTGGVVGDITTEDEDAGDSHTYNLSGTNAANFEIVNGQLKLKDNITADHSMISAYSVTVTSTDNAGATISKNYIVEVNVAPTFVNLSNNNVDENYVGNQVGALTVIDANTNDEFTYTISGDGAESFEVINGQLKVKSGTWLDYETKTTYTIIVKVTDQGGLTFEKSVTINVNDVNYGNPYHNENFTTSYDGLPTDPSIVGQLWSYYYIPGIDLPVYYANWGDYYIGFSHDDDPNTPLVITYSLIDSNSVLGPNYDDNYDSWVYENRSDYSDEWETIVDAAFEYWGNVSGITFVKVDDNAHMCGDIRIGLSTGDFGSAGGWSLMPYYYDSSDTSRGVSDANDIWIRKDYDPEVYGSYYGPTIMIHEIGHSLGLSNTQMWPYPSVEHNTTLWSVMAYAGTSAYIVNDWDGYDNSYIMATTPGINDIKTIQFIYGMTPESNAGNTTYTYSGPVWETIYDTGGIDTIDASSYTLDITLNLVGGNISYIGTDELKIEQPYGNGSDDWDYAYSGFPIGIAEGTVIENVTTGSGDDTITCNTASNTITCGSGNDDVLLISSGDIVLGGHGNDNFYINSFDFNLIDGGVGTDATDGEGDGIYFHGLYTGSVIDLRAFTDNQITNIEDIYINDGKASILKISALSLRNLEGSYFRDMDGDGIQEFVCYIYADADLDEVQVNNEGWSLTVPVDTGDNVYTGYDYYFLSGTLFTQDIWFAVNTGTTVTYINESEGIEKISPDRSNDEIVENKNPTIDFDDNNINIPIHEPINSDPFRYVCGRALCALKDTVSFKSVDKTLSLLSTSNHLDMTSDLLIVEHTLDYSILLPDISDLKTEESIALDDGELFDLLISDSVDKDQIFLSENFAGDDIFPKSNNRITENNHDAAKEYDLFLNFEESIILEDLIYTSELG